MRIRLLNSLLKRLLSAVLLAFTLVYLLQMVSPLRLNSDASMLLSMAVSAFEGQGYLFQGQPTQFPPGYPFFIQTLLQLNIASSAMLIFFNLLFLWIGLLVVRSWAKSGHSDSAKTALPAVFVLASWVMIKHITIPLTEFSYIGASFLSLSFVTVFWVQDGIRKWRCFAVAVILAIVAVLCRTVGLALFPVLFITMLLHRDHAFYHDWLRSRQKFIVVAGIIGLILAGCTWFVIRRTAWYELQFISSGSYGKALATLYGKNFISTLFYSIQWLTLEFGELFGNIPLYKAEFLRPVCYLIGLLSWCAVLYGAWLLLRSRRQLPLVLYFLSYSGVIFLWAAFEPRLFLPLLPLLSYLFFIAADDAVHRWPFSRWPLRCYLVLYLLMGLISLTYSTGISLSGKNFSELYGQGPTQMTYRYAFNNGKVLDMKRVDKDDLRLLQMFEPLAKRIP